MTSAVNTPQLMTRQHTGDLPAPEWIAFGDPRVKRSLVLLHHDDDDYPDTFYQMHNSMTVFGFGRAHLTKILDSAGQRFSIGLIDSDSHAAISQFVEETLTAQACRAVGSLLQEITLRLSSIF